MSRKKELHSIVFTKSPRKNKKYRVFFVYKNKHYKIDFGDVRYQHFRDRVMGLYSHLDHNDETRRQNFIKRFEHISSDPRSPSYWSRIMLW